MSERCDVAIVGAGIAGLAAAAKLAAAGRSVTVLEARPRIGGRIHTRYDLASCPIELGAEFVHGEHAGLLAYLEDAGMHRTRRTLAGLHLRAGRRVQDTHDWDRVFEVLASPEAPDIPFAEWAQRLAAEGRWTQSEVRAACRYVEGYMAADAGRVSARALALEEQAAERINGDVNAGVREGYDALIRHLAGSLPQECIRLQSVVARVVWKPGQVRLDCPLPVLARRCIVTVPLGVLQLDEAEDGALIFDPALPVQIAAARQLAMGTVLKIFLRLRTPFARIASLAPDIAKELDAMGSLRTPEEEVPFWWKIGTADAPILVGWIGGPRAGELSSHSDEEIIAAAVRTLAQAGGAPIDAIAAHIDLAEVANWQKDPLSRGAYSWVPAGALGAAGVLATPVENTLYFAGEAVDTAGYRGTVHGALQSGERAADAILRA